MRILDRWIRVLYNLLICHTYDADEYSTKHETQQELIDTSALQSPNMSYRGKNDIILLTQTSML